MQAAINNCCPCISKSKGENQSPEKVAAEEALHCNITIRGEHGETREIRLRRDQRQVSTVILDDTATHESNFDTPPEGFQLKVTWSFGGVRIPDDTTVASLGLEDGAVFMETTQNVEIPGWAEEMEKKKRVVSWQDRPNFQLTEACVIVAKGAFTYLSGGKGEISNKSLGSSMRSLGLNPTEAEIQGWISQADAVGNGVVDFPEFLAAMSRKQNSTTEEDQIIETFRAIDKV